jgi:hypothetical protein
MKKNNKKLKLKKIKQNQKHQSKTSIKKRMQVKTNQQKF